MNAAQPPRSPRPARICWSGALAVLAATSLAVGCELPSTGVEAPEAASMTVATSPPLSADEEARFDVGAWSSTRDEASDPRATVPAVVPGWQGIANGHHPVAYDVPPGWVAKPPTVLTMTQARSSGGDWETKTAMSGVVYFGSHECGRRGRPVAVLGSNGARDGAGVDTEAMAEKVAMDWAQNLFGSPSEAVDVFGTVTTTFAENGLRGHDVSLYLAPAPTPCGDVSRTVRVITTSIRGENVNVILHVEEGEIEVGRDTITTIVKSIRPRPF